MTIITPEFDHAIYAVSDLETACADMQKLFGCPPVWRGTHPEYGTANALFNLDNTYIELLAPEADTPEAEMLRAFLAENGDGLFGMAFGVPDLTAYAAQLKRANITPAPPRAGSGRDANTGATRQWENMFWSSDASRGITSFAITHKGDELPAPDTTPDQLRAVDHIVVNTHNADAAARFYGDALGIRLALRRDTPQGNGEMLFFRLSSMSIEVIASDKADPKRDSLWGIAFRTRDIAATHKRLADAKVEISEIRDGRKPGTKVCTVKSHNCNVPTLLIQH